MPVCGVERKRISFTVPILAYESLEQLARKEGVSINQYSRRLVEREIMKHNLPLYWQEPERVE